MGKNKLSVIAILLWLVTVAVAGLFFVKGTTEMAEDGRVSIILKPNEKSFVLTEMRMLLEGVQGIIAGLSSGDLKQVAEEARRIGMASAVDVNPNLMMKLPVSFKQQGMELHKQFDQFAELAESGASAETLLAKLSEQLSSCVACHRIYRLDTSSPGE